MTGSPILQDLTFPKLFVVTTVFCIGYLGMGIQQLIKAHLEQYKNVTELNW